MTPAAPPAPTLSTGCCPPFDPTTWHEREVVWRDHPFMREHLKSFFHIPLGFGRKMKRVDRQLRAANVAPARGLMLTDELSPWRSDLYIDVTGPVPGAEMATLSGTFMTRVYDGPFRELPHWLEQMKRYVKSRGRTAEKIYFAYTTCPACAKAYGHNYVVLFAKVADAPS